MFELMIGYGLGLGFGADEEADELPEFAAGVEEVSRESVVIGAAGLPAGVFTKRLA